MKKRNDKNKIRTPEIGLDTEPSATVESSSGEDINESAEELESIKDELTAEKETKVISELTTINPDLLTGDEEPSPTSITEEEKIPESDINDIDPIELDLSGQSLKNVSSSAAPGGKKGVGLVIAAVIVIILAVAVSLFYEAGIKEKLKSPLMINGVYVDSAEFSFMYHFILIDNGVDIFAADTPAMLEAASENPAFATNREFFLDQTAQQMQRIAILYDDARENGYNIEEKHYALAQTYVDWLQSKADELGVPLDTYIRGVFGNQVDEQCILNTLAKMYFTDDYRSGAKLVELQATSEQAEAAYNNNRNAYDTVDYKLIRMVYEQRDQAFIDTANLHAQEIVEATGHDPALFESAAAEYFSGEAQARLLEPDSALVSGARYDDFTHTEFRDWLFDFERTPGDCNIFTDSNGFPIIICFVSRDRQSVPLRDVRFVRVLTSEDENAPGLPMGEAQLVAQEIYDHVTEDETSIQEIENMYTDDILAGNIEITHSSDTYPGKYEGILDSWIFDDERAAGDHVFLDTANGYYIVYMVEISGNPEWYDRVNSYVRMENYSAFMNEMQSEYDYEFIQAGLDDIRDLP